MITLGFELVFVGDLQLQHVVHPQKSYMTCLHKSIWNSGTFLDDINDYEVALISFVKKKKIALISTWQ